MAASGSRIPLDTNVVIAILRGDARQSALIGGEYELFLPSIALGELYYGAFNASDSEKHLTQIGKLLRHVEVVGVDSLVARVFGIIKRELKKAGTPIPENDIWIAAIAKSGDFLLASDDAHFKKVEDLPMFNIL
jgi:tRNA(fMet)-specific endonuclease VapC